MRDARIDAYISKSGEFARPILIHLRALVHKACPEVEETMKWSFPNYMYHGILCNMAAFKEHCSFGFWKASRLSDPRRLLSKAGEGMGSFGKIKRLSDLPPDSVLIAYIREAAELNRKGMRRAPKKPAKPANPLRVPADLAAGLRSNAKAKSNFSSFTPSQKREYVEWIVEAKTDETRKRRLATSVTWIAAGKRRNWKYER